MWCNFSPYKSLIVALGCLRDGARVGDAYAWARGMLQWVPFGDPGAFNPSQVAAPGAILNQNEFHLFGGVASPTDLSGTGNILLRHNKAMMKSWVFRQ